MLSMKVEKLTEPETMVFIVMVMTAAWALILEVSKNWICNYYLPSTKWWPRACVPTTQMMQNFGFPIQPTEKFPEAVSDFMARDFYAFLTTLCFQHGFEVCLMAPVVIYGWDNVTENTKCLFVLGTLSELAFNIYDGTKTTIRTFTKHPNPIPLDFWVVIVAMHHTLGLSLIIPLNMKYIHLAAYHQTIVALLFAASVCYLAGNYKFALDVTKASGFYQYKLIVLVQLATILYARVYLWFPDMISILSFFKEENDTAFYYGGGFLGIIFSVFNILLMADALKAAIKWLPRRMPKNEKEVKALPPIRDSMGVVPLALIEIANLQLRARRKFKGAVNSVVAMNRFKEALKLESKKSS